MSLTISATKQFVPTPEGSYLARCYLVVDLGRQINKKYNTLKGQVLIGWELDTYTDGGVPFVHMQQYCSSNLNEHTRLRLLIEDWRGRKLTLKEAQAFKLSALLDSVCYLSLKHQPDAGRPSKLWANVAHISPPPPGADCNKRYHPLVHFDLDYYSKASFLALSPKIRNRINQEDLKKAEDQATKQTVSIEDEAHLPMEV